MNVFTLRNALSVVFICAAIGASTASASTVALYRITVKATFQNEVLATPDTTFITSPEWFPTLDKSVELTFSMHLDRTPFYTAPTDQTTFGEAAIKYDGKTLQPSNPAMSGQLSSYKRPTRHRTTIYTSLAGDVFGFRTFFDVISVSASFYDPDATALDFSKGPPRDFSRDIFKHQYILFIGLDRVPGGLNHLNGLASVDNVSVDIISPAPVPLPASVFFLGVGLAGLGALRRPQKAA